MIEATTWSAHPDVEWRPYWPVKSLLLWLTLRTHAANPSDERVEELACDLLTQILLGQHPHSLSSTWRAFERVLPVALMRLLAIHQLDPTHQYLQSIEDTWDVENVLRTFGRFGPSAHRMLLQHVLLSCRRIWVVSATWTAADIAEATGQLSALDEQAIDALQQPELRRANDFLNEFIGGDFSTRFPQQDDLVSHAVLAVHEVGGADLLPDGSRAVLASTRLTGRAGPAAQELLDQLGR